MAGVRDPRGVFHECDFFEIEGLCEHLVKVASTDEELNKEAVKMSKEVTRLSSSLEFFLHVIDWKLLDPFCKGESIELGKNLPIMTDKHIGYSRELDPSKMVEGVIDEKGFISFENFGNKEQAASVILMHEMIGNRATYLNYLGAHRTNPNFSAYDFLVSRPNVVGIKRPNPEEEKFVLNYVSANNGRVAEFIEYLKATNRIAELDIRVQPDADLMEVKPMGK